MGVACRNAPGGGSPCRADRLYRRALRMRSRLRPRSAAPAPDCHNKFAPALARSGPFKSLPVFLGPKISSPASRSVTVTASGALRAGPDPRPVFGKLGQMRPIDAGPNQTDTPWTFQSTTIREPGARGKKPAIATPSWYGFSLPKFGTTAPIAGWRGLGEA